MNTTTRKLYARINGQVVEAPEGAIAFKYADPLEDGRWIYTVDDRQAVERDDPSLLVELSSTV